MWVFGWNGICSQQDVRYQNWSYLFWNLQLEGHWMHTKRKLVVLPETSKEKIVLVGVYGNQDQWYLLNGGVYWPSTSSWLEESVWYVVESQWSWGNRTWFLHEINFDVIKNGTLCKWTTDFLQYGIKLFPLNVQKKLTSDTTEIINQKKGFFKKTFPGGSLDFHTFPCVHGSMVYVIEETCCNSNFKIQFKGKVYGVNDNGAGKIISLLPNTKHSV